MTEVSAGAAGPRMLLGPQREGFAEVAQALDDLGVEGPVALITAGWQENEGEDEALRQALGRPAVNLGLHARSEALFTADRELALAYVARQKHLQHLQEFHRVRLDAIDEGDGAIAVRHVDGSLLEEQRQITLEQLRHLDAAHVARCEEVQGRFEGAWRPGTRPALATHRAEVAALVEQSAAVVIAGGHVISLLNRLRLFAALEAARSRPVVAWSAGAMALTDRVVLFHDSPPFGKNIAQVLGEGMGWCPGIVAMPDLGRRVRLDHREGIRRFVLRMAPARCLGLDPGARLEFEGGALKRAKAVRLTEAGVVERGWSL